MVVKVEDKVSPEMAVERAVEALTRGLAPASSRAEEAGAPTRNAAGMLASIVDGRASYIKRPRFPLHPQQALHPGEAHVVRRYGRRTGL